MSDGALDLLILGGTRFAGRWLAEQAMAAGHRVTLLHRGRTDASAVPQAEHLIADRDGGLAVLGGRRWDAVVDTSGYLPRVVRASAEALKDRVGTYLFVSSISVYAEPVPAGFNEDQAVTRLDDPTTEEWVGPAYGGLKVLCEGVVREVLGERAVIVRPGVIAGPRDYMDRFAYWVRRVAKGGDVLAPGDPDQGVQFVDARDLAGFYLDVITQGVRGVYQVTGPRERLSMRAFLEMARDTLDGDSRFTWVDEAFLMAEGVKPWSEMPLWVPAAEAGFAAGDVSRALAAGLKLRPVAETLRSTLAWEQSLAPAGRTGSPVLTPERETQLLARWRARG